MISISFPALRPSHPHGCRKRAFGQGHALSGRFAGLDRMTLLSGYGCLRATDEEASGGGSVKGSPQFKNTKATTQKSVFRLPQFSHIPTCGEYDTCKSAPAYAPQSFTDTCGVAFRPAFRCPRRHVCYADLALRRILPTRLAHSVQAFAAYRFPMSRILTRHRRHTHQRHAVYNFAPQPIRTYRIPDGRIMCPRFRTDACSFVRHCLRGPAYVSYRRFASYFTAGEGRCPFEPRKGKRQARR